MQYRYSQVVLVGLVYTGIIPVQVQYVQVRIGARVLVQYSYSVYT